MNEDRQRKIIHVDMDANGRKPKEIYVPDLHIDSIEVKTRDFK
jgi:hypothetical protein